MRLPKAFHLRHPSDVSRGGYVHAACGRVLALDGIAWHRPALVPYHVVTPAPLQPWEDELRVCPKCAAALEVHMSGRPL